MFKKNTAVTGFQIGHFIGVADGIAVTTGTPACKRLLDGTPGTLTNAAAYDATAGVWKIDLAAADMNGDMVGLSFTLAACLPISYAIKTNTVILSDVPAVNVTMWKGATAPDASTFANAGTYSYSNTVDDGSGNLLDGVFVQCATNSNFANIVATTYTNALGAFTVRSDTAGTHYLRLQLAGYNFSDQTVTLA